MDNRCEALVYEPPHYTHRHRCPRIGHYVVSYDGSYKVKLCGQHRNKAEKWRSENRIGPMIRLYWKRP